MKNSQAEAARKQFAGPSILRGTVLWILVRYIFVEINNVRKTSKSFCFLSKFILHLQNNFLKMKIKIMKLTE